MGACTSRPDPVNPDFEPQKEDLLEQSRRTLEDVRARQTNLEKYIEELLNTSQTLKDTAKKYRVENKMELTKEFLKRYKFKMERVNKTGVFRDKYQKLIGDLEDHINTVELVDSMAAVNAAFERNRDILERYQEENDKMTELKEQVDDTHKILEDDINDTEYDDIISSFDNDSMREIAEFLQKNTVQIVTSKFKERVLQDFECCIRDSIQQHEHEVLLSTVMEEMREHCIDCAQQLFDRLERLTNYLDYSTDATNGSIYSESSKVTTILAFSTDDTRDFVRNAFVEVLVNWAYTSILMKTQVQEALYKGFDDVMRDEIHQNASTVSVETSVDMFDSIAKHVVKELTTILQAQFDKYYKDHGIQQSLEKSVKAMAEKIMNYAAPTATATTTTATTPTATTPTTTAVLPPPIPKAVSPSPSSTTTATAVLPPPTPKAVSPSPSSTTTATAVLPPPIPKAVSPSASSTTTTTAVLPPPIPKAAPPSASASSTTLNPSISLLPQSLLSLPVAPTALPTLGRPLPEDPHLSKPRATSPIKGQTRVPLPPPPPLRSSFGVPPAPKTTSTVSTISVLPPPPPKTSKTSHRVAVLE